MFIWYMVVLLLFFKEVEEENVGEGAIDLGQFCERPVKISEFTNWSIMSGHLPKETVLF